MSLNKERPFRVSLNLRNETTTDRCRTRGVQQRRDRLYEKEEEKGMSGDQTDLLFQTWDETPKVRPVAVVALSCLLSLILAVGHSFCSSG